MLIHHGGDIKSGPLFTREAPTALLVSSSHYKPETAIWPSEVYDGDSCTRTTVSFQWIEAQLSISNGLYSTYAYTNVKHFHMFD